VTTLFAALNVLTGKVLSMTDQLHRHQEWLRFLKTIDRNTPKKKELHLIVDNYATHKLPSRSDLRAATVRAACRRTVRPIVSGSVTTACCSRR
jgi:hypothetical protein